MAERKNGECDREKIKWEKEEETAGPVGSYDTFGASPMVRGHLGVAARDRRRAEDERTLAEEEDCQDHTVQFVTLTKMEVKLEKKQRV